MRVSPPASCGTKPFSWSWRSYSQVRTWVGPWPAKRKRADAGDVTKALRVLGSNLHRRKLDTSDMLWIGSGRDTALAEEVARNTGLKVTLAAVDQQECHTQEWKKRDLRRCRVVVLTLPASSALLQD